VLDRLKRLIAGAPAGTPPEHPPDLGPGPLDWITHETPYRFRTWLADPAQRDGALRILETQGLGRELTVATVDEPDDRVRLDIVSTFRGTAAYTRPLAVLRRHGVAVRGIEYLDLVEALAADELARLVMDFEVRQGDATVRRRVDALAGENTIRQCIEMQRRQPKVRAWRLAAVAAASRTPGALQLMLSSAVEERDDRIATMYAGISAGIGRMAELTGEAFEPPADLVLALARRGGRVTEAAHEIARYMPASLLDELTAELCRVAGRGTLDSVNAVMALRRARVTDEVRTALEAALASSVLDVSDVALGTLGALLGAGARPYWQAGLESNSAPRRMAAEDVIGQFGDADDVPLAAEHLHKIIRRKSAISWQPPRGSDIIGLLVRHRTLPEAEAALQDLTKRWPRLPTELQEWLLKNQPALAPASPRGEGPATADDPGEGIEPPLEWPLPTIERNGNDFHLAFWDTDVTDIRDRFEDLIGAHPAITILDGDREWETLRIKAPDPEALIAELWAKAQATRPEG
jgi:hypothetical protein